MPPGWAVSAACRASRMSGWDGEREMKRTQGVPSGRPGHEIQKRSRPRDATRKAMKGKVKRKEGKQGGRGEGNHIRRGIEQESDECSGNLVPSKCEHVLVKIAETGGKTYATREPYGQAINTGKGS